MYIHDIRYWHAQVHMSFCIIHFCTETVSLSWMHHENTHDFAQDFYFVCCFTFENQIWFCFLNRFEYWLVANKSSFAQSKEEMK